MSATAPTDGQASLPPDDGTEAFGTLCPERPAHEADQTEWLEWITAQLRAGFEEYHALDRKKLDVALHYGELLLSWRQEGGHGDWQKQIEAQFGKAKLRTCNRWKRLAGHKEDVAAARQQWPEVRWGVVNMLDYLAGKFDPNQSGDSEDGEDGSQALEAEGGATSGDDGSTDDVGCQTNAAEPDEGRTEPKEGASVATTFSVPTGSENLPSATAVTKPPAKGKKPKKGSVPPAARPVATAEVAEYEVEVVQAFKVSVPKGTDDEAVRKAFEVGAVRVSGTAASLPWAFSGEGMKPRLNHVKPW